MSGPNQIYERVKARDEEFIIWCYPVGRFNQRWKFFLTRESCACPGRNVDDMLVRPGSLKRVREWLQEHRIHGHSPDNV